MGRLEMSYCACIVAKFYDDRPENRPKEIRLEAWQYLMLSGDELEIRAGCAF